MTDIVWEDPPKIATGRPATKHTEIAAQLRANPGKWAMLGTMAPASAGYVKKGKSAPYRPAGSFEAVARNHRHVNGRKSPVADIYARYVGDPST